ncbi:UNVERIFIED_CONTAM: Polygalacturonase-1 non-catalytic subunit beta [Sesamum angustifolium]|uniref:Polygalacturonase-1 non-catalytic subunit beta n=1 Tax=Sesamum angustifolium TaxID=2727405 RepID=A0AAW2M767_9LAMI
MDNVDFATYLNKNFTNYGGDRLGGVDSFKNYSDGDNVVSDDFRRYSRDATGHSEKFTSYATEVNMADQSFSGYGTASTGGDGEFSNYNHGVNVPNLRFTEYADSSNGRKQTFTEYTTDTNAGDQTFTSYGKNGNGATNEFTNYGKNSNVMGSNFKNYGKTGNGGNDTFTSYGDETNNPQNTFKNYGAEGNSAVESFKSYRSDSNVGSDDFHSYGEQSNAAQMDFATYAQDVTDGSTKFSGYGEDASAETVDFKQYGPNTTFKAYAKEGVTFASYTNESAAAAASLAAKGKKVNRWAVEPGKFFREEMLKSGSVMPMPDIRDKMPRSMTSMLVNSLNECERAPSPGETKRCVASIEDMIDFATSVLGRNVAVHTTENTQGSNGNITIGQVKGINGGNVTKSVSCHQSLFPYLVYYCHSVPKVRVYEADILDPESKARINHGVAICHLDTSSWSPGHGAFIALGSGPGKIEVCHWIFENDMTWTVAD